MRVILRVYLLSLCSVGWCQFSDPQLCSHDLSAPVLLGWQTCWDWWRDWSARSTGWSSCLQVHVDLLETVEKSMVSMEVGPCSDVITGFVWVT